MNSVNQRYTFTATPSLKFSSGFAAAAFPKAQKPSAAVPK